MWHNVWHTTEKMEKYTNKWFWHLIHTLQLINKISLQACFYICVLIDICDFLYSTTMIISITESSYNVSIYYYFSFCCVLLLYLRLKRWKWYNHIRNTGTYALWRNGKLFVRIQTLRAFFIWIIIRNSNIMNASTITSFERDAKFFSRCKKNWRIIFPCQYHWKPHHVFLLLY